MYIVHCPEYSKIHVIIFMMQIMRCWLQVKHFVKIISAMYHRCLCENQNDIKPHREHVSL